MNSMKCRHIQAQLLLFLEGELELGEAARVREHLRDCSRCGALAEELSETQDQVEVALRTAIVAPATLEARVMATVRRLPARRMQWPAFTPPWGWQRRLVLAGAAASLVLAGFVAGRTPLHQATPAQAPSQPPSPRTTIAKVPAAQASATQVLEFASLRSDYVQSLTNPRAVTVTGNDPRQVAQRLGKAEECIAVPVQMSAAGAQLLGGGWRRVAGAPVAFMSYEWKGQRISLYQADRRRLTVPALRALRASQNIAGRRCYVVEQEKGLTYVAWCVGQTHYVLVARQAPERLLRLAQQATIL